MSYIYILVGAGADAQGKDRTGYTSAHGTRQVVCTELI